MKPEMISKQVARAYKVLLESKALTAKEIGAKLEILPNGVYRAIKTLEKHGAIKRTGMRPEKFKAVSPSLIADRFGHGWKEWFLTSFGSEALTESKLKVSFIQNRKELLDKSLSDQRRAKKQMDLIVSGDEVPAEVMLENKKAIGREVKIRILAQKTNPEALQMYENWKKMGIQVRLAEKVDARVIIVDSKIVYLVSYNPERLGEGMGVRFAYAPMAELMKGLFEQRWKHSREQFSGGNGGVVGNDYFCLAVD